MKSFKCVFIVMSLIISMCGCDESLNNLPGDIVRFDGRSLELTIYDSGNIVSESVISADDKMYKYIVDWFSNNTRGWRKSYINYVPKYIIRSKKFSIRQNGNIIVVIYKKNDGGFVQLEKEILGSLISNEKVNGDRTVGWGKERTPTNVITNHKPNSLNMD